MWYKYGMKYFDWNPEKNKWLIEKRNISFEQVVFYIEKGGLLDIIENIGGALIIDTELFDVYEKGGQKGLAFRIIYQSNERTLTDVEVNASQQKIIKAMEERGWEATR